jgi:hypothetical protein
MAIIFSEDFTGSNGSAWNGTRWPNNYQAPAGGTSDIQSNRGRLVTDASAYALNQQEVQDIIPTTFDMYIDVLIDATTEAYFEIEFRSAGAGDGNWYDLSLHRDSGDLNLQKQVSFSPTTLGSTTLSFTSGDTVHLRLQADGADLRVKAWINGASEPGTWTISANDSTYSVNDRVLIKAIGGGSATAVRWDIDNVSINDSLVPPATFASSQDASATGVAHNATTLVSGLPTDASATGVAHNATTLVSGLPTDASATGVAHNATTLVSGLPTMPRPPGWPTTPRLTPYQCSGHWSWPQRSRT